MSKKYNAVKKWWDLFRNITMIKNAVEKNWITKEEYKEITGEDYD